MMHKVFALALLLLSCKAISQTSDYKNALSYKFVVTDYNSLDPTYREYNPKRFFHADDVNFAGELGYFRYFNPSINFGGALRIGSMDAHHNLTDPSDSACMVTPCEKRYFRNEFFTSLDLVGQYKFNNGYLLPEDYFIAPYLQLGLGGVYMQKRKGNFDLQLPVALGVNVRLNPKFYIQAQAEYRQSFVIQKNNLALSAGFVMLLGKEKKDKKEPKKEPVTLKDSDGDGVYDVEDDCPDVAGPASFKGCPDTDGDGLRDIDDECPTVAGPIENKGCPIVKSNGAIDDKDKAIIQNVVDNVNFETGKSDLLPESKLLLDEIVKLMQKYPKHRLKIQGHTDNVGAAADNLKLSELRAESCFKYLKSKGVDPARMEFKGFGQTMPIADNNRSEGRRKNRRVEFVLYIP